MARTVRSCPRHRGTAVLVLLVAALLALPVVKGPSAHAHGVGDGGVVRLEQTLGGHDLTLTVAPPAGVGPMPVLVDADADTPRTSLRLAAVPRGAPLPPTAAALVVDGAAPAARAQLAIERDGDWEILVDDGRDTARVPVRARPAPTTAADRLALGGFAAAVVLVLVAVALRARPRPALVAGAAALVALTAAVTALAVVPAAPAFGAAVGGAPGVVPAASGRADPPHVGHGGGPSSSVAAGTGGTTPAALAARVVSGGAGAPTAMEIDVVDATSGDPVDDLVVHDEALMHLVVVGPGETFTHLHPVRTAPGRYLLRFVPAGGGRHGLFAEIERESGGVSLLRTSVTVAGPLALPAPAPGPGVREVGGMRAEVRLAPVGGVGDPKTGSVPAGRPVRLSMTLSERGAPVADLQPWLGMAGHLLVLGPPGPSENADRGADAADVTRPFGHVHDMRAPSTGGVFGPDVGFTWTFPRAGRYATWAQVRRGDRVLTVPTTVDVGWPSAM